MEFLTKREDENYYSSKEIIDKVLSSIGLERERTSTYVNYSYGDGEYLRLRISDHGLFLQYWYDKNRESRINGESIPKLDIGQNLSITFTLTKEECKERGCTYPQKIANQTKVKTEQGNNAKPQFSVRHIAYYSDKLSDEDIDNIIKALNGAIKNGSLYQEPIKDDKKFVEWIDTSNLPPKKIINNENINYSNMNKNRIKLTESQLHRVIRECVKSAFKEGSKKKDPMVQWFKDFDKASQYRETMDYINKGGRNPNEKKKEDDIKESYHKENALQRFAYENQEMKSKIREVARFANDVADIARITGKDNYTKFYKPLASNIYQMLNLWNFLIFDEA